MSRGNSKKFLSVADLYFAFRVFMDFTDWKDYAYSQNMHTLLQFPKNFQSNVLEEEFLNFEKWH